MKKYLSLLGLVLSLYSYETLGLIWEYGDAEIASELEGEYDEAVSDAVLHWNLSNGGSNDPAWVEFWYNVPPWDFLVKWSYALPNTTLGKTLIYSSDGNFISSATIYMNHNVSWSLGFPDPDKYHFPTAIRHELGHFAGLEHEPDLPDVIMYPTIAKGEERTVQEDDIDGLRCLYGSFGWGGGEHFTLSEPSGDWYNCNVPVCWGLCNGGGGNTYIGKVSITYNANDPNPEWTQVSGFQNMRGACITVEPSQSSNQTQIKVEWFDTDMNLVAVKYSNIFGQRACPKDYNLEPVVVFHSGHSHISSCEKCEEISSFPHYKSISIYNKAGQLVLKKRETEENPPHLFHTLHPGLYFVRYETRSKVWMERITVLKQGSFIKSITQPNVKKFNSKE